MFSQHLGVCGGVNCVGRVTSCMAVCVNSLQKHRLCLGASNNRHVDRLENPLPKQKESTLTNISEKVKGQQERRRRS